MFKHEKLWNLDQNFLDFKNSCYHTDGFKTKLNCALLVKFLKYYLEDISKYHLKLNLSQNFFTIVTILNS